MAGPLAEFVVSLDTDGNIVSQGSVSDAIAKDATLQEEMKREEEAVELDEIEDATTDDKPADEKKGKLVVAEEIAHGHVSWKACQCHTSFFSHLHRVHDSHAVYQSSSS